MTDTIKQNTNEKKIYSLVSDRLSWYRTKHKFVRVMDISCAADYFQAEKKAKDLGVSLMALGNGSNVLFYRRKIKTLILRNHIKPDIESLGDDRFRVSSSVKISKLLKHLMEEKRDAPYNLASVPATIGGAVAMNAGTGRDKEIYIGQYLERIILWREGREEEVLVKDLELGFRRSIFSEEHKGYIVAAILRFPKVENFTGNPMRDRMKWARENQELSVPNCGSVFRVANTVMLRKITPLFNKFPAYISKKSPIWISNHSSSPFWIKLLITLILLLHRIKHSPCELEIRIVK